MIINENVPHFTVVIWNVWKNKKFEVSFISDYLNMELVRSHIDRLYTAAQDAHLAALEEGADADKIERMTNGICHIEKSIDILEHINSEDFDKTFAVAKPAPFYYTTKSWKATDPEAGEALHGYVDVTLKFLIAYQRG